MAQAVPLLKQYHLELDLDGMPVRARTKYYTDSNTIPDK